MRSNNIKFTIFVWLGLALLFTLIVHLLSYRYIRELTWTNKQISQSYQVLKTAEELYRVVLDIESSGRGFSITGDRSFLLTFEQNFRRTEQLLNDLEAFKAYNPTLKSRISQLRSLVEEKLNFGREVVESTLTKGTEFSQELIAGGRGQALSNRILALVSFFRENENRLLIEHTRRSEDIEDNVFIVVMVSGILAILIVLLAVIFIFRDLNKRKELEDELKENESRISQFLEAVPVGVYVVDNKGRPYYANKQSQHLLGRGIVPNARMDEYPEIYRAYIEGTDERYPVDKMPIVQALKGVTSTEDDIEVRTGEHIRLLEISACPIFDLEGNVNYAIASFIDITQRKETEKLLKRARSMAEESARIKESFLANMSHEIRTPMNAIIGFSELLEKTRLDKEQLQFVKAIRNSGENLLVIINDILDFSKIESGMMRLEKVSFSLHSLLHSVENLLKIKSGEKKLELLINYFPDTPDIVEGDPTRLTQILINLIGNAIKFTEKGKVEVSVFLEREEKNVCYIHFRIKDTGIGIPADKLGVIFERFNQANIETSRRYGGTGLGLSIVKSLVELHGGTVYAKSEVGAGSEFNVILPYERSTEFSAIAYENWKERTDFSILGRLEVLLVEDNILNQKLAVKVLTDEFGFNVAVAVNGAEGVEYIKNNRVDIVLMDLQMPLMDGYQAVEAIRKGLKSDIPIIAMTAHALSGEREKCLQLGFNEYISKPFRAEKLYETIRLIMTSNYTSKIMNQQVTDLSYIKEYASGNNDFIREMVETFLEQLPEYMNSMTSGLEKSDWDAVRAAAHKMVSSLGMMGVKSAQTTVMKIEEYALNRVHLEEVPAMVAEVSDICRRAYDELKEELTKY